MINFMKNNYYRIRSKKFYLLISILMTMISIFFAIYMPSKFEGKYNIAVVSKNNIFQSKYVKFTVLTKEPSKYELVLGKYDGVLIDKGNGKYDVKTIKNNNFKKTLQSIVNKPKGYEPEKENSPGMGTNIIGFVLMFILLQGILFIFTLAEDIELKQIERITAAPVSFFKYLFSHFLFAFLLIFMPTFFILVIMKCIAGFNIGFSLLQYILLLGIICSLSISFGMFINALVKVSDTANMMGSSIIVLTTILAGSFYSFEKGNKILEKILWILPQKDFLSFVQGLESRKALSSILPQITYVIILTLLFFTFSIINIKKDYVLKKD